MKKHFYARAMKNTIYVESGRKGGKIGGIKRAHALTPEQRSEIARIAAIKRWKSKGKEMATWRKVITRSEAIRPDQGSPMPFIRCTQGMGNPINHHLWFRNTLFGNENWSHDPSVAEKIMATFDVTINGQSFGSQQLLLDHNPRRADNHSAPTMHILYNPVLAAYLQANDVTGKTLTITTNGQNIFQIA